ncbi:hypothetical protein HPB52_021426 [Rhipicephalus sanguineus]|uniref:Uncharacterized protein n=1 Tax=Rhipicephalus sanguineus TaxID=34632 RepID=A0A9D4PDX0_RHISA|nr:hypothetical protein HPB52_021426 [Rhipicephalus sanguineus]
MVQQLHLRDTLYRVAVYPAPHDDTCKGVIRGIDLDLNDSELREVIFTIRKPSVLEEKSIKNTPVTFVRTPTQRGAGSVGSKLHPRTINVSPTPLSGVDRTPPPTRTASHHLDHLRGIQEKPLRHTSSETSQRPPQPLQLQGTLLLPPSRADMGGSSPREATVATEPTTN